MKMQIETEIQYQLENQILTVEDLVSPSPIVCPPPPGRSASRSPGSAFPAAIFGVDAPLQQQSVETSEPLFETLDHEELANIAIQHTANMDDAELNTPTVEMSFSGMTVDFTMEAKDVWTAAADEPLYCANPMEIEGRDILDAPIYFEDQEPAAAAAPVVISIPEAATPTKARKKLRLIMPKPAEVATAAVAALHPAAPTTPEVVDAIEKSLQKNSEESIDLLAYVTDSTIKVDDPSFLAYIGSTTPGVAEEVSRPTAVSPPKGKKLSAKRVAVPKADPEAAVPEAASVPAPSTSSSTSSKYRRMRDLNNVASKRCRNKRKRKQAELEAEQKELEKRNEVLKAKCLKMEELVERMKAQFLKRVAKPKTPLDLDQIVADRLAKF